MSCKRGKVGKAWCIECEGKGNSPSMFCRYCEGTGWIRCEHQEWGDHNDCLDCGYDRTPDLMDEAKEK